MNYRFDPKAPQPMAASLYSQKIHAEFQNLLSSDPGNETAFQEFFERNPFMVPGSRSEIDFGPSGHGPEKLSLISQPRIKGLIDRQPDFMWLSCDSQNFTPVLVEIEAPSKKYFTNKGHVTSDFSKAKNQIDEWTAILKKPENILSFYEAFDIDKDLRRSISSQFSY